MTILLLAGAAGAWLFIIVFLLDGWTRPGYRSMRHPVSALALGSRGFLQTANFVVCGLAITAGSVAIAGALGSVPLAIVLGVFGVALMASGVFPMDAMRGYPPGTPDVTPDEESFRHQLHDKAGVVVFAAVPVAAAIAWFFLQEPIWKWYSGFTAAGSAVGFIAFGQAWEDDAKNAGLVQKATIILGWLWVGLLFVHASS